MLVLKLKEDLPGKKIVTMFPIKLGRQNATLYKKGDLGALEY